jgi:hypothetical protein
MTLVDTNVLLDIFTNDPTWADWSAKQLDMAALHGRLVINGVVYAELSVRFQTVETLDTVLADAGIVMENVPRGALFLAVKAFQRYRAAGGSRTGVLPDFFIGAHAAIAKRPLLTRDVRRYRTSFPSVTLIAPET